MRVSDNGSGMSREDAALASSALHEQDRGGGRLERDQNARLRGEALPSMASMRS